jgi:3-mercaptopyruvate sulfurtransferase SseA
MSDSAFLERSQNRQDVVPIKWLIERLESPDVAIVDASVVKGLGEGEIWVSDRAAFEAGHIPRARFADLVSDFSDPIRPRKVVASMQAALTAGLGQDRHSRAGQQPSKNTAARTAGALPGYRRDAAENNQPH